MSSFQAVKPVSSQKLNHHSLKPNIKLNIKTSAGSSQASSLTNLGTKYSTIEEDDSSQARPK